MAESLSIPDRGAVFNIGTAHTLANKEGVGSIQYKAFAQVKPDARAEQMPVADGYQDVHIIVVGRGLVKDIAASEFNDIG